ncbi:hypothetical protein L1049_028061 [Liquidambar formosana]|uniref:Uncharacterized protein n=1 Tax=Liquidambar formosana TaxID=63359 RepID=A0AAP0RKB6_LIQFO
MVEELDLTDQDISTISAMIDSEIRSHIPDWASREISGDNSGGEVEISDSPASETKEDASPLTKESALSSANLVLERLPSGRRFWSDSPRAIGENSPVKPGPSNLYSQAGCGKHWG